MAFFAFLSAQAADDITLTASVCPAPTAAQVAASASRPWQKPFAPVMTAVPCLADQPTIRRPLPLLALTALAIGVTWWWLGKPVQLPPSPLAPGEKLYCLSYAPFRDGQTPLVENTQLTVAQIDEDLKLLARYTDCIRTYSIEFGQDQIAAIAQRHGLKVLQGLWLSNKTARNRAQIATVVALARKYPETIRAVIVGNEVLLRGELSLADVQAAIREVKAQISQPVTYADVWEFWLRYSDLKNDVDFVTIHILPYWEDFPLRASLAAAHIDAIRKRVAAAMPGKEIVIGEVGWPSQGRMREGALPSPVNQARVIEDTLTLAKRENFHVNVIEAFDQPWKRRLEGSVGRTGASSIASAVSRNSPSAARFPTIRTGSCKRSPASRSPHLHLQRRGAVAAANGRRPICGCASPSSRSSQACCSAGPSRPCRSKATGPGACCACCS